MTSVISADSKELECTSMSRLHRALASIVFCLSACGVAAAQQPQLDQLRLIAPAAPGGGWDQTARVMQQVLQRTGIVRLRRLRTFPALQARSVWRDSSARNRGETMRFWCPG